jgi:hypothetical protein
MSEYTRLLTAEQLIAYIARDYVELSEEKVLWQRNEFIRLCREWLEYNNKDHVDESALNSEQVQKLTDNLIEKYKEAI